MGGRWWSSRRSWLLLLVLAGCDYRPLPLPSAMAPLCNRGSGAGTTTAAAGDCQGRCGASEMCEAGSCRSRFTEFPFGKPTQLPCMSVGADGDIWIGGIGVPMIVSVTSTGGVNSYPTGTTSPICLTVGPDGNIWFLGAQSIRRLRSDGAITDFPLPSRNPFGMTTIVTGPDGNIWFGDYGGRRIGRITLDGVVTEFAGSISPWRMTHGPDAHLWFSDPRANQVGRVALDGTITLYPLQGDESMPLAIAAGPDGNVWTVVRERQNDPPVRKIVRISPPGAITEFPLAPTSSPVGITAGPDCNVWFTDSQARLGRISPSGTVTEFPLPAGSDPQAIVTGSDGNLWFTETNGWLGRFVPP